MIDVGRIEFNDARQPIESPVRFLSDLLLLAISVNIRADYVSIRYGLYEMFVDNCKKRENR